MFSSISISSTSASSETVTEQNLPSVIESLFKKAKETKNSKSDKRILLEIYGFALGLIQNLSDLPLANQYTQKIQKEIIDTMKDFIRDDLQMASNTAVQNLEDNFNIFKNKINLVRNKVLTFEAFVKDLISLLQNILGQPECSYSIVGIGSLGTGMTTPYSDIEYFVLVDSTLDSHRNYFQNLAYMLSLMIIGFGETPIYRAELLLKEYEPYYQYLKKGVRVDEHKEPTDRNFLYGLINTPEAIVQTIALPSNVVHRPNNHLTASFMATRHLVGDEALYNTYCKLFEKALGSTEYLACLKALLQQDRIACDNIGDSLKAFDNEPQKTVDLKKILNCGMHLAFLLGTFLKAAGEKIDLKSNVHELLVVLKDGGYISEAQYQGWDDLVRRLFYTKVQLQTNSQSGVARISLVELNKTFNIKEINQNLQEILWVVTQHLDQKNKVKNNMSVKQLMPGAILDNQCLAKNGASVATVVSLNKSYENFGVKFNKIPRANPDFIMRPALWCRIINYFSENTSSVAVLTAIGLGGGGKTQLVQQYYLFPPKPYQLRAWFTGNNKDLLYQQYIELGESNGLKFKDDALVIDKVIMTREWLEKQGDCLLVFDDFDNHEDLEEVLPRQGNINVLATSRNEKGWHPDQKFYVELMEEDEALALIYKVTNRHKNPESDEKLKSLVNALGRLPLALAQAGAYMYTKTMDFEVYLRVYAKQKTILLNQPLNRMGAKHEAVWVTFDLNFIEVQNNCPDALLTLKQASWFGSSQIPEKLLESLMVLAGPNQDRDMHWGNIKESLTRYSLMRFDINTHTASMHPILQDVLQEKQSANEKLMVFMGVCKAFNNLVLSYEDLKSIKSKELNALLVHAEQLHKNAQVIAKNPEVLLSQNTKSLLEVEPVQLSSIYHNMQLTSKNLEYSIKVLKVYEEFYGANDPSIIDPLANLANALVAAGKFAEAQKYLEKSFLLEQSRLDLRQNFLGLEFLEEEKKFLKSTEDFLDSLIVKELIFEEDRQGYFSLIRNYLNFISDTKERLIKDLSGKVSVNENYLKLRLSYIHFMEDFMYELQSLFPHKAVQHNERMRSMLLLRAEQNKKPTGFLQKIISFFGGFSPYAAMISGFGGYYATSQEMEEYFRYVKEYQSSMREYVEMKSGYLFERKELLNTLMAEESRISFIGPARSGKSLIVSSKIFELLRDFKTEKEFLERALDFQLQNYGPEDLRLSETFIKLADVYRRLGNDSYQVDYLNRALIIRQRHLDPWHPQIIKLKNEIRGIKEKDIETEINSGMAQDKFLQRDSNKNINLELSCSIDAVDVCPNNQWGIEMLEQEQDGLLHRKIRQSSAASSLTSPISWIFSLGHIGYDFVRKYYFSDTVAASGKVLTENQNFVNDVAEFVTVAENTSNTNYSSYTCISGTFTTQDGDAIPMLNCIGHDYETMVFPKVSASGITAADSLGQWVINGDTYHDCRATEFKQQSVMYCEGEQTTLIYHLTLPKNLFENFNGQLMLGAVLVKAFQNLYHWTSTLANKTQEFKNVCEFVNEIEFYDAVKVIKEKIDNNSKKIRNLSVTDKNAFQFSLDEFHQDYLGIISKYYRGLPTKVLLEELKEDLLYFEEELNSAFISIELKSNGVTQQANSASNQLLPGKPIVGMYSDWRNKLEIISRPVAVSNIAKEPQLTNQYLVLK